MKNSTVLIRLSQAPKKGNRVHEGWGIWDIVLADEWPDNWPYWLVHQSKEISLETHWWHCNLLVKCDKAYLTFAWAYTGFHSLLRATRASKISSYSQKASLCGHHTSGSQSHYLLPDDLPIWPRKWQIHSRKVSFILKPSCVTQNVLFFTKGFWPFVDQSFKKFEWLTSQSLIPQPRCMQALGSNFNSKSIYLLSSWVLALGKCEWPLVDSIILCPCTENKCERIHFSLTYKVFQPNWTFQAPTYFSYT